MNHRQIRLANLQEVFCATNERNFNAGMVRLCVLYEDLRLELLGATAQGISQLDILDTEENYRDMPERIGRWRRFYFVRRSVGTIREFAEALQILNDDIDFQLYSKLFDEKTKTTWNSAIDFFAENKKNLDAIRNDIGGHFGHQAALNALDQLAPDGFSSIEVKDSKDIRFHFVGEIVACALKKRLSKNDVNLEYDAFLRDCLVPAYKHASGCVQILALEHLWSRFGK